jgi:hypothetical protein
LERPLPFVYFEKPHERKALMKLTHLWPAALLLFAGVGLVSAQPAEADKVRALVRQLDDDKFEVRDKAEASLRKLGKKVLPQLKAELARTKSVEVRRRLQQLVGEMAPAAPKSRVADLVRMLGDDRFEVRQRATRELVVLGRAAIPELRKELEKTGDPEVRTRLTVILRQIARGKK